MALGALELLAEHVPEVPLGVKPCLEVTYDFALEAPWHVNVSLIELMPIIQVMGGVRMEGVAPSDAGRASFMIPLAGSML